MIVDEMHEEHPELLKDQYWDSVLTTELPYTVASMGDRQDPPQSSTAHIEVKKAGAEIIPMVPSNLRIDEMVGKTITDYQFPDNNDNDNDDSDKVRNAHIFLTHSLGYYIGGGGCFF